MTFSPKLGTLSCEYCAHQETSSKENQAAHHAHDYLQSIATLQEADHKETTKEINCPKCGGAFTFETLQFATHCPYCDTPAVTEPIRTIKPQGIIPFAISRQEAKERFKKWLSSRWFAPNSLATHFNNTKELIGHYLPFWTFDAQTTTQYQGYKGEYIEESSTQNSSQSFAQQSSQHFGQSFGSNDSYIEKEVGDRSIQWHSVSGEIKRSFNDLAINANSDGIEHIHVDSVAPWDIQSALDFDTQYVSGFDAKEYRKELPSAYKSAQKRMEQQIKYAIEREIGGDKQKIEHYRIEYSDVTYKNLLFPLWIASFRYKGKHYEYAINGLSGKVSGERPYSMIKIAFAIAIVVVIIGGIWYLS